MVASFHIPELQILLGLLKLNKYGRKAELLQRAQAALSRGVNRQIQEEIRELYRYGILNCANTCHTWWLLKLQNYRLWTTVK